MKINKLFTILLLGIFLISFTSAIESLGTLKQGECVEIKQACASCTYTNISSVSYPNSSIALSNVVMTDSGNGGWNYTFCNTNDLGRYDIIGKGDKDSIETSFATYFKINSSGTESSIDKALIYLGSLFILIFLFIICLFLIHELPSKDNCDDDGILISINRLKYIRPVVYVITYMLLMVINFVTSNIGFLYLEDTMMGDLFFKLYRIMMLALLPMIIIWFIYIFYSIFQDREVKNMIDRGVQIGGNV